MSAVIPRPRFYSLIAAILVTFAVIGFARTYYLRFLFDRPPLHLILHLHGLAFTAWMALFVAQTRFIAAHRFDLHRKFGVGGVVVAVLVVIAGLASMFVSAATPRITKLGLTTAQASIVPLISVL